jgi:hypothetical protein
MCVCGKVHCEVCGNQSETLTALKVENDRYREALEGFSKYCHDGCNCWACEALAKKENE